MCNESDWIDGNGTVHCGCSQRFLLELQFRCGSTQESTGFGPNSLDARKAVMSLRKTLLATILTLNDDDSTEAEKDELDEWINVLC